MTTHRVRRWGMALVGTLTLVSVALLAAEPFLLAATAVPLAYVLHGALARVPPEVDLRARRRVETAEPTPGEPVRVTLTVENAGDRALTDVRVVDGVPEELVVVDGSPRGCRSLRPGESAEVTYELVAKRGSYAFGDPVVRVRPLAATAVATAEVAAEGATSLTSATAVDDAPPSDATLPRAGTQPSDGGGSGVEFHATREYQHGDPVNRIDWRRYAKAGELTTVEYRREQSVRTVVVVDARPVACVTPEPGYPTGAELAAYAAERMLAALGRGSAVASVAAVGLADEDVPGGRDPDGLAWVDAAGAADPRAARLFDGVGNAATRAARSPGHERGARKTGTDAGATTDADDATPADRAAAATDGGAADLDDAVEALLARLPPTAQVVVCSPLLDDWPVDLVGSLAARGYPATVVSPDVTRGETVGQRVAAAERAFRLEAVELAGASAVDWDLDRSIDVALRASGVVR
ncbi:DUF58 domain-containing protein [Halomicrobium salinisoli]|uniref:DUF58 domain-containing protein n=1 Tax=Halomicrobium salinisoli TaxID=2878391 RepID=UPI001CF056DE|nr:DUF58 domain-containing protein [Halomicrobium salinisoli]